MVALVNAVTGTLIAWVLVRDASAGKALVNALIDLPFALPTIVAGLTLLALYGPSGPLGDQHRLHALGVLLALLFVTLPFVVRAVQPVLLELDRRWRRRRPRSARAGFTIFRRIVLPNLLPAILSGVALAFARAVGEFGSVVLISRQPPVQDRGRLGLHLRPDPERRRSRRGRGLGRAALRSRSSSCSRSARSAAGATRHDRV